MSINIAICLSGEPRYRHHAANTIHNFIKDYPTEECNVDIFYHFWDNITKRQSQVIDDPIIETVNKNDIKKEFKPTIGICESKDYLEEHINVAWNYIQKLKKDQNNNCKLKGIHENKEDFSHAIKSTNNPPFSQIISMCKSLKLMTDYAEKNSIYYDIIIRSRSDVKFLDISYSKIKSIIHKDKLSRYIQFPSISVRTIYEEEGFTPFVEYCFFVTSAKIINADLFKNYTDKVCETLFFVKEKKEPDQDLIAYRSSHNCVPLILKQHKKVELGAPIPSFKFKLEQMKSNRTNYK